MTSRDFCFWLQGYLEINDADATPTQGLGPKQVECIQKHLALAFKHEIDPSMGDKKQQDELNKLHGGGKDQVLRC